MSDFIHDYILFQKAPTQIVFPYRTCNHAQIVVQQEGFSIPITFILFICDFVE